MKFSSETGEKELSLRRVVVIGGPVVSKSELFSSRNKAFFCLNERQQFVYET
jgi:hypothetical protein